MGRFSFYMPPNALPGPAQINFMSSVFIRVERALLQTCCNQLDLRLKTDVIVFMDLFLIFMFFFTGGFQRRTLSFPLLAERLLVKTTPLYEVALKT